MKKSSQVTKNIENLSNDQRGRESGIAMLMAILAIATLSTLMVDMIITGTVNMERTLSVRDRIRAEYMAKSGMNMAVMVLGAHSAVSQLVSKLGEDKPLPNSIDDQKALWNFFNKLKDKVSEQSGGMITEASIGKKSLELLESLGLSGDKDPFGVTGFMNEEAANMMRSLEDGFAIEIIDESSKINLSGAVKGNGGTRSWEKYREMLKQLFSGPAETLFLREKGLEPAQLAYRILDYINDESSPESGLGDKNSSYERQTPPYKVKGIGLDDISELKMVEGFDEEVYSVFADYLTVFPYLPEKKTSTSQGTAASNQGGGTRLDIPFKINYNTAKPELISSLLAVQEDDKTKEIAETFYKQQKAKESRATSNQDLTSKINALTTTDQSTGTQGTQTKDASSWFTLKSNTYRIIVKGRTGEELKTIEAVSYWGKTDPQPQADSSRNSRKPYSILQHKVY